MRSTPSRPPSRAAAVSRRRISAAPTPRFRRSAAMPRPAPALLPPREIYGLLRDYGYAPVGTPRLRGRVLHRRGDRPGRRGRPRGDRRPQRADRPLHPGRRPISPRRCGAAPAPHFREVGPAPRPPLSVPRVASRSAHPAVAEAGAAAAGRRTRQAGRGPTGARAGSGPAIDAAAPARRRRSARGRSQARAGDRADRSRCRRCRGWSERRPTAKNAPEVPGRFDASRSS